jgi:RNA polymerase sigma-70 factor (ECF subfamily)
MNAWHPASDWAGEGPADTVLVRRVRGGDLQAYANIVRRHQGRLRSVLSFYCISPEEVEERIQEAFVMAYANLDQYDASAPFFPWLRAIALNALRMAYRRREVERGGAAAYLRRVQLARVEDEREAEAVKDRGDALRRCLDLLPRHQADLLRAKYGGGRSVAELAARMKTTEGALKVRLLRLREMLRECIKRRLTDLPAPARGSG